MIALAILATIALALAALYVHDRRQTAHTILRNYPIIGYFRYFAETLGEYMRQYQYLPDWAERPFNRLERAWVYRSAKGVSNLRSFGSENVPSFVFRNAAFPVLDEEKRPYPGKQIGIDQGPGACRQPYFARSFFNISGMSYGALSHAAVSALSRGAKVAGIWMATGEGGLAPFHLEGGCDLIMQMGTAKYGVRNPDGNPVGNQTARSRRSRTGPHVRGQAGAGCQARQRRHPARRQSDPGNRRYPRHPGRRNPASAPTATTISATSANSGSSSNASAALPASRSA